MMISNNPGMADGVWEPFSETRAWTLGVGDGLATVYVRYRDAHGNESETVAATIWVVQPTLHPIFLPMIVR